jgi:hypothetical protein
MRLGKEERQMATNFARHLRMLGDLAQKAGPYLLIEIILPGGTLVALILFLYRRGDLATVAACIEWMRLAGDRVAARMRVAVLYLLPDAVVAMLRAGSRRRRDGLEPLAMGPRT